MGIKLRVVGIFYSVKLEAAEVEGGTVKDVLEAAKKNPGEGKSFNYESCVTSSDKSLVKSFTAKYDKGFPSPVLKGDLEYPAGTYTLEQNLDASPSYTIWQYYVLNENGQRVELPKPAASYTTDLGIKDGYTVIWRLVSVLHGPTQISEAQAKLRAYSSN